MNTQQLDDLGFCPSFSCYSSDSLASTAATKVSNQFHDMGDDECDFSFILEDDESSANLDITSNVHKDFPLFNRELLTNTHADVTHVTENVNKEAIDSLEYVSSSSDSSDGESSGVFCVWRHRSTDAGSSPLSKCKKSSSTGSGSKRWRFRDLILRRSNSEGKEPMGLVSKKKLEIIKQEKSSGVVRQAKPSSPSMHELLYVQQRAKREGGKRRSYLPYRQGLVGFFTNSQRVG